MYKAELNNKSDVLKWYEARDNSCYIVCTGLKMDSKQIFSKWINDDHIIGNNKLDEALSFIENNNSNCNTYTIMSFPYDGNITDIKLKDLEGEVIRFQFHLPGSYSSNNTLGSVSTIVERPGNDYAKEMLAMMRQQNDQLLAKLEALEQKRLLQEQIEDEEDEEDEIITPTPKDRLMGALAGIVENPAFSDTILGLVGMAVSKFITPNNNTNDNGSNSN